MTSPRPLIQKDGGVFGRLGDVLAGEAEAAVEAGDKLEELRDVLQLRSTTGQHNAADELVAIPRARIS